MWFSWFVPFLSIFSVICALTYSHFQAEDINDLPDPDLKIILLGDSAVGKSKLIERYLMDEYNPRQLSTYALTLFRKEVKLDDEGDDGSSVVVDFWDTAGCH